MSFIFNILLILFIISFVYYILFSLSQYDDEEDDKFYIFCIFIQSELYQPFLLKYTAIFDKCNKSRSIFDLKLYIFCNVLKYYVTIL